MPTKDVLFSLINNWEKSCVCLIPVLELDTIVATGVELWVQLGYLVTVTGIHKVDVVV